MLRAAAIDIGTNTLKLTVGEVDSAGCAMVLADERLGSRLGEGVDSNGMLSKESQLRTLAALRVLVNEAREIGVDKYGVVATSAMRDAANRDEFIDLAQNEIGITVEVLSEEDEALFSYRAVTMDPELGDTSGRFLVMDVGGGSTELAVGSSGDVSSACSLRLGAVRLTERFLRSDPPADTEIADARMFVEDTVRSTVSGTGIDRLVGVGGTVVNVAAMVYGMPVERYMEVHGLKLSREQVRGNLEMLSSLPLSERKMIVGLEPDRADVIIGGVLIVDRVMEIFGVDEFMVSTRGLRYGVLYELLGLTF